MKKQLISSSLTTPRLILINSTRDLLEGMLMGENVLASMLNIHIANPWSEFGDAPFKYALDKIKMHPGSEVWWSWLPILVSDNTLIGNCGYKGPPEKGVVEIGYEVALAYRQKGFATEMAKALIKNAFAFQDVDLVLAHTLAEENASVHVLRKCGFQFDGELVDPEDGNIWRWKLPRGQYALDSKPEKPLS
ncbi:MAG: GNAT family N-acetyltransferase [Saprospiraceae bacterium]|nr:GNAT family N-acetyltransferase [Candidatus Opimibacter iunctus]